MLEGIFGKTVALPTEQSVLLDDNYPSEAILGPASKVLAGYQPVMPAFQGAELRLGLPASSRSHRRLRRFLSKLRPLVTVNDRIRNHEHAHGTHRSR
ncbi:MAG: hypothetical protein L0387_34185 [Acidobacteria bacterium]|nr:hypothetical protein [Acidobacteriota bacterium]MCI0717781.1 hypothetical protein [Acidobacteriota bacterium]